MSFHSFARLLVLSALTTGTGFSVNPAFALPPQPTKLFGQQKLVVKGDGLANPEEVFIFDVLTEGTTTTVTKGGYVNPGIVTPTNPANPGAVRTDANPLLTSQPYSFTGYKIVDILNGKRYENGVYTGDIQYRKPGGTNAEDVGVFNYEYNGSYPTDLISHALPDDLWNPGGEGLGFSSTPSLPADALDNYVSFGGFAFDVFENGLFDEPYQLFTVSAQPTSGNFTDLLPGDYAGCPGSCRGAKVNSVPGPFPVVGVGVVFGFTRRLRKRIRLDHACGADLSTR